MKKTSLIFDLDGTLLDTIGDLTDSTNYALEKFGFPQRTTEEVRSFVGNGLKMLIFRALPAGTDDATIEAVLRQMKMHYTENYHNKTVPYSGIPELLARLHEDGYPMAIVSNKADSVVSLLRTLYFDGLIPVAVGETEQISRKPAPDMVWEGLRRLGTQRDSAVYIGDSEVDIRTADNAGLPCLSVSWGFRTAQQLQAAGARQIVHSPQELYTVISSRYE